MKAFAAALACALLTLTAPAVAHPDISGYWMISFKPVPPNRPATPFEQGLIDTLPKGAKLLADSGLAEFKPGDYGGLKIRPDLVEAARHYDPEVQRSVSNTCRPPSILYSMQGPFPMEIFEGRDLIVIKMEYFDLVRIIFMNETTHPEGWPNSFTGHSIGHWEGDDLVVDTVDLQPSTLFNNGIDHSAKLHLVERFRLSPDGKTLGVTQLFEDPDVFEGQAARFMPLDKMDGQHVYPYDCDPSYGLAVENRERK